MRWLVVLLSLLSTYAVAFEPQVGTSAQPVLEYSIQSNIQPSMIPNTHNGRANLDPSLEWSNTRPEQRQALDHFYRSLEQHQTQDQMAQRMQRQQHVEQLRGMTPEQRQQHFLNFVQQYQRQQTAPEFSISNH